MKTNSTQDPVGEQTKRTLLIPIEEADFEGSIQKTDEQWDSLQTEYRERFSAQREAKAASLHGRIARSSPYRWLQQQRLGLSVILGLVIVVALGWLTLSVLSEPEPIPIAPLPVTSASNVKSLPSYDEIMHDALSVVDGYYAAETWEERLPFVREREVVEPLMRAWYARVPFKKEAKPRLEEAQVLLSSGRLQLAAKARYPGKLDSQYLVAVKATSGWQIDWEITSGYQASPWEEFSSKQNTTPSFFRVIAARDGYFNFHFQDQAQFDCYRFTIVGVDQAIYGYVPKQSHLAMQMSEATKDKKWSPMILSLKFPPAAKSLDQVEICEFLQEKWYVEHSSRGGHFDRRSYPNGWRREG